MDIYICDVCVEISSCRQASGGGQADRSVRKVNAVSQEAAPSTRRDRTVLDTPSLRKRRICRRGNNSQQQQQQSHEKYERTDLRRARLLFLALSQKEASRQDRFRSSNCGSLRNHNLYSWDCEAAVSEVSRMAAPD